MKTLLTALCFALSVAPMAASAADVNSAGAATLAPTAPAAGVVRVKSRYGMDETVRRLRADIASKGIQFFTEIDQSHLGAAANIPIRPSRLILFGNPPLGVQFLSSNPYSGLDWPVRMLILEEADGSISVAWTDFAYLANRYQITDRSAQFAMASAVAASIASSTTQ
ncbi:DUF302 domain-containing protein [Novosphingobium sp. PASSN1]|uniref:DUF302 domain-containing protein n=1 Tax=Novosphingobium sp. PASSN1 TaxID=2015561 RepID=UPI0025FDCD9C|nr:DUF302 domain-containing protein [Novosphingobium sp. PASSN1]